MGANLRRSAFLLCATISVFAMGIAQAQLPSRADIETAMQRTFGYDPSVTWTIYDIRPSPIAGVADVLLSMNKGQPQHIFVNPQSQTAIVGEAIPFGPDPYREIRAILRAADGPARGSAQPAIAVVIFTDLACAHCKAAAPAIRRLSDDFAQIRIILQPFPLPQHAWAMKAAEYADCVAHQNPSAYWTFTDKVLDKQAEMTAPAVDDKLKEMASGLGVDAEKAASCSALPETEARIKKSMALGESLDVTEVPTAFINGRRVLGIAAIPYESVKQLVQFEIDHANR